MCLRAQNAPVGVIPAVDLAIANDRGFGAATGALGVASGHAGGIALWNGSASTWALVYGLHLSVSAGAPVTAQIAGLTADPALGTALAPQPKRVRASSEQAQTPACIAESSVSVATPPSGFSDTFLLQVGVYDMPALAMDTVLPPGTGVLVYLTAGGAFIVAACLDWIELGVVGA